MNKENLILSLIDKLINSSAGDQVVDKSAAPIDVKHDLIGEYVIVRSRNEGVNAGIVSSISNGSVSLKQCRRLWWFKPKSNKSSWYEGVSIHGLSNDSKVSEPVQLKVICEDFSITVCTKEAKESISGIGSHNG